MKRKTLYAAAAVALILGCVACHKNNGGPKPPVLALGNYTQTDLVADTPSFGAAFLDPTFRNAWGIAVNPSAGLIWISANHDGSTKVLDSTGKTVLGPIPIAAIGTSPDGGSPTGAIFNPTPDFIVPSVGGSAKFIFVNEDGTIAAWPLGAAVTFTVVNNSAANAVYKGGAMFSYLGSTYLAATNFKAGTIEVYDKNWQPVTNMPFKDPNIPAGYAPFNVANIDGNLYVTYAKQKGPDNEDDDPGAGNGFVDIFLPNGNLLANFTARGPLNSPWGIARVPEGFGLPVHSFVIGNFGDGRINVYDSTGLYLGALQNNGQPITIEGLWALVFPVNESTKFGPQKLYFTSGPGDEQHGLFGYLKKQ